MPKPPCRFRAANLMRLGPHGRTQIIQVCAALACPTLRGVPRGPGGFALGNQFVVWLEA